jgi:Ni/Fe-hydrogenase subunit HybB-like protein
VRALVRVKEILWVLAAVGAVAIVARLLGGLGAATDLSDAMPWGMWKILNMVAGVAVATGGFALAATVYIFKLERYRPVLKPAILIAFLGYGSSCFALVLDIGLPHAFYKPIIFWNHHSFLFEVAWCVMLYFSVTAVEVSPTILEQHGKRKWAALVHRATLPLVIVGITLSSLHHTSLGSLFLVVPGRLDPLWYTSWLPWLFISSAVGGGVFLVVLATRAYWHLYRQQTDLPLLSGLATGGAVVLALHLALRLLDLGLRGQLRALVGGSWESYFLLVELVLLAVVPIVIVLKPAWRRSSVGLVLASVSAVCGVLLNRLNVGITGLVRTSEVSYFPSLSEVALSVGVLAMAGLAFFYLIENYPIFYGVPAREHLAVVRGHVREFDPVGRAWVFGLTSGRGRISLIVVVATAVAMGAFSAEAFDGIEMKRSPVQPPRGVTVERAVLALNGDRDEDRVLFPHQAHQERLGKRESCGKCHHQNLPHDQASACSRCHADMQRKTSTFNHEAHVAQLGDKWSCTECHDPQQAKNRNNAKDCYACHQEDMGIEPSDSGRYDYLARSYTDAMHGLCIRCHEQEDSKTKGPRRLAECQTCHGPQQHLLQPASPAGRLSWLVQGRQP